MLRDLFSLFPAYAGVIPLLVAEYLAVFPFPRICGGDPMMSFISSMLSNFSPHMRG